MRNNDDDAFGPSLWADHDIQPEEWFGKSFSELNDAEKNANKKGEIL
jgi:hypothetical protein